MFQGDLIGAAALFDQLSIYAAGRNGWAWTPAPLIAQLAERGGAFADLNG